ncbi:MAG: glycosyltransferase family 4 protein [Thermodesulfobacteriota bacterium]
MPRAAEPPLLEVLALAPLPYLSRGRPAFHGGGTVFYAQLLGRLARRGHRVEVYAEAPRSTGEQRTPLVEEVANLRVRPFAYEHHSSHGALEPGALRRTRARLEELLGAAFAFAPPDVVLVGRDVVLPLVLEACEQRRVPVVLVSHGPAVAALTAGRYPAELADPLRAALARADLVVAVARHVEADLRRLGVTRVVTVPNAVDTARFRPAERDAALLRALDVADDAPVVVHVSLLREWKRAQDLVESAPGVLRAEPRTVYVLVGDGPSREALVQRAAALGVAASFRFVGEVLHAEMPRYLGLADVVVHPSEREGFPLLYREAQACGRALLASDIPPAREAIEPEVTGVLFPVGDVARLAAETRRLRADAPLRRRLGAAARREAERCGADVWTAAYERALRGAVARRAR